MAPPLIALLLLNRVLVTFKMEFGVLAIAAPESALQLEIITLFKVKLPPSR